MRDTIDKQEKQEILETLKNLEKISHKIYQSILNKIEQIKIGDTQKNSEKKDFITKLDTSTSKVNSIL